MTIIGRTERRLCNGCHPRPTIMQKMPKLDVYQCSVCFGTQWHYSSEAISEETSDEEVTVQ